MRRDYLGTVSSAIATEGECEVDVTYAVRISPQNTGWRIDGDIQGVRVGFGDSLAMLNAVRHEKPYG